MLKFLKGLFAVKESSDQKLLRRIKELDEKS
jgi:hypothetical protein